MHGFLVGQRLARERLIIDNNNLVAGNQSGTFSRSVADNLLYVERILADGELDTYTRE